MINYSAIKYVDSSNGSGVRTSIYLSGCTRHCKGCFNPETWNFCAGEPFDPEVWQEIDKSLEDPFIDGLSILGGEPLEPENVNHLATFLAWIKVIHRNKTVWLFTGYEYPEVMKMAAEDWRVKAILGYVDVMKCGPFIEEEYEAGLVFKGSKNQTIYDMNASRKKGEPVLWSEDD